jgi:hypothetical protein
MEPTSLLTSNTPSRFHQTSYGAGVYNSGDLSFKTSEGDVVKLSFNSEQSYSETASNLESANGTTVKEFSAAGQAAFEYSMAIQGNLNKEELDAIQKLAAQVAPVAHDFFSNPNFDPTAFANQSLDGFGGVVNEMAIDLKQTVTATFSEQYLQQGVMPGDSQAAKAFTDAKPPADANPTGGVRDFSALVDAVMKSSFESEGAKVSNEPAFMKSLSDLMRFLREQFQGLFGSGKDLDKTGEESAPTDKPEDAKAPAAETSQPAPVAME